MLTFLLISDDRGRELIVMEVEMHATKQFRSLKYYPSVFSSKFENMFKWFIGNKNKPFWKGEPSLNNEKHNEDKDFFQEDLREFNVFRLFECNIKIPTQRIACLGNNPTFLRWHRFHSRIVPFLPSSFAIESHSNLPISSMNCLFARHSLIQSTCTIGIPLQAKLHSNS